MKHATVFTKNVIADGQYRLSALDLTDSDITTNYFYHIMLILRLKGIPSSSISNNGFAYNFAFNFGG